ncbi:MAG: CAP domain-containing protein [Bacteroidota bacterium]
MKRRFPHYNFIIVFAIALTSCSETSVSEEGQLFENETTSKVVVELSTQEQMLIDLVNEHRTSQGLNALEFSAEVYEYASEHNEYMISQGELSHDNFESRASTISGITSANFVAENVAKDYQMVDDALQGWLSSTSHKNTIEGDFTHTTLSIMDDDEGNPYYTQIFFRK